MAMVEEQVEMEVVLADAHALLAGDKAEARPHLQKEALYLAQNGAFQVALAVGAFQSQEVEEIGVAEHRVGGHVAIAEVGDF